VTDARVRPAVQPQPCSDQRVEIGYDLSIGGNGGPTR
jgi:hypothetical protein